jgi:hypothetical protein
VLIVAPLAILLLAAAAVALLKKRFPIGLFCVLLRAATLFAGLVRQCPVADRLVRPRSDRLADARRDDAALPGFALLVVVLVVMLVVLVSASTFNSEAIALARA